MSIIFDLCVSTICVCVCVSRAVSLQHQKRVHCKRVRFIIGLYGALGEVILLQARVTQVHCCYRQLRCSGRSNLVTGKGYAGALLLAAATVLWEKLHSRVPQERSSCQLSVLARGTSFHKPMQLIICAHQGAVYGLSV